jgi:hypothetical protein
VTRKIWLGCLAFSVLMPAVAFTFVKGWWFVLAALVTGTVWLVGDYKRIRWCGGACFAILAALAGVAVTTNFLPSLLLLALTTSLCAWDLQRFTQRLEGAAWVDARQEMEQAHLKRLLGVILPGFAVAVLSMLVTIPLPFTLALFLALAGISLLSNAGQALRKGGKTD